MVEVRLPVNVNCAISSYVCGFLVDSFAHLQLQEKKGFFFSDFTRQIHGQKQGKDHYENNKQNLKATFIFLTGRPSYGWSRW